MDGRGREREEREEEGRKRTGEDQREGKWMAGEAEERQKTRNFMAIRSVL